MKSFNLRMLFLSLMITGGVVYTVRFIQEPAASIKEMKGAINSAKSMAHLPKGTIDDSDFLKAHHETGPQKAMRVTDLGGKIYQPNHDIENWVTDHDKKK